MSVAKREFGVWMMVKRYRVRLEEEQQELMALVSKERAAAYKQTHARILLLCDENQADGGMKDEEIAAATEESRPVLTGAEVKMREGSFTMAAPDGFRLAVHHGELNQSVTDEISVIIPARTMTELQRLPGDQDEPVDIMPTPQKGQVMFRLQGGDRVELVSQLMQGTFPNYDQLIPQGYTTRAILDL